MSRAHSDAAEDISATVGIVDGRVAMSADVEADLQVHTPEVQPLSSIEPHATLRLAEDDVRVAIELDAEGLDALADALYHAQEGDR